MNWEPLVAILEFVEHSQEFPTINQKTLENRAYKVSTFLSIFSGDFLQQALLCTLIKSNDNRSVFYAC